MPIIRTKNTVLVLGTAIGLAAACGGVSAQTHDQAPMRTAQARGAVPSGDPAAQDDEKEKKKREEEKRRREHTPPGGAQGTPGGGHGMDRGGERPDALGRGSGDHRGRGGPDADRGMYSPGGGAGGPGGIQPPLTPPSPSELRKDEAPRRDRGRGGPDEDRRDRGQFTPGGGAGGPGGVHPPQTPPSPSELRKDEAPRRDRGRGGPDEDRRDRGQFTPGGGAGGPGGIQPPQTPPSPSELRRDEEPRRGGERGGTFDRDGHPPRGARGEPGREPGGMGARPVPPPPPSPMELESRRRERAMFSRGHLGDISKQRHERRDESGRTVIEEPGNRRIIREGGRAFIQHDETERLRRGARDFREERGPRGERRSYFTRPDGVVIISIQGEDGRLIRRMRRDHDGREVIIINNDRERWRRHRGHDVAGFGFSVDLAPPRIRIPRERYYVDAERANEDDIYEALSAPPVDDVEADYTLDEIRYSKSLRDRLRTVNLSTINFEFGSWEVTQDQIGRLDIVARAMRSILRRNPDEVFLIGGHTDAVGSDEDNLSLSDRRAESVARVLTDEYGIPAENLVTQGYGEQYLLLDTQGAERGNRRVEFQRITPLLARK